MSNETPPPSSDAAPQQPERLRPSEALRQQALAQAAARRNETKVEALRARRAQPADTPAPLPAEPRDPPGQAPAAVLIKPLAPPARIRGRHRWLAVSFLLLVVLPGTVAAAYLYLRAADQYASTVGFAVRAETARSPVELLGGIADLGQSSSSDTDILYEYIQSQELVARIDAALDLRKMYSLPRETDPVFAFDPGGSIEDLVNYWGRMVKLYYDSGTGLIEIRALAFRPEDATAIAEAIFSESSRTINELSAIARADATHYAEEELERAVERLKQAREALTAFRSRAQIVDPEADIQVQMGLLNTLNQQLAEALIDLDQLRLTTHANDPRVLSAERRIKVIEARIADERRKFSLGGIGPSGDDYATVISEFERLTVDREFAEQAYTAALANYDEALSEARRKSRYLAAYVGPTRAETSRYPQREVLAALVALALFLVWAIGVLVYYSVRDRR